MQGAWIGKPPDKCTNRGEHQFDEYSRRANKCAVPTVWQHPRIGNIAIKARRQHEKHHAYLMTLTAEMFAGESVTKLMHDLGHCQGQTQPEPVLRSEEGLKRRQSSLERLKLHQHKRQRG